MTREEAIEELEYRRHLIEDGVNPKRDCRYTKALKIGIKALSIDYETMAAEIAKYSGVGGLNEKGIMRIIKKYTEEAE